MPNLASVQKASGGLCQRIGLRITRGNKKLFSMACFRVGAHPDGVIRMLAGLWASGQFELSPEELAAAKYKKSKYKKTTRLLFRCDAMLWNKILERCRDITISDVIRALATRFTYGRTDPEHRAFAVEYSQHEACGFGARGWKKSRVNGNAPRVLPPARWPVYTNTNRGKKRGAQLLWSKKLKLPGGMRT
jgi:hypothetical protein